jgi:Flp pilus assembly protein TadB
MEKSINLKTEPSGTLGLEEPCRNIKQEEEPARNKKRDKDSRDFKQEKANRSEEKVEAWVHRNRVKARKKLEHGWHVKEEKASGATEVSSINSCPGCSELFKYLILLALGGRGLICRIGQFGKVYRVFNSENL